MTARACNERNTGRVGQRERERDPGTDVERVTVNSTTSYKQTETDRWQPDTLTVTGEQQSQWMIRNMTDSQTQTDRRTDRETGRQAGRQTDGAWQCYERGPSVGIASRTEAERTTQEWVVERTSQRYEPKSLTVQCERGKPLDRARESVCVCVCVCE